MEPAAAGINEPSDDELLADFEACTLSERALNHRAHVRLAWIYLKRGSLPHALLDFSTALKRYAASRAKHGLYHETITFAFIFLINERIARGKPDDDWPVFAESNRDLLEWSTTRSVLLRYYRAQTLQSELARRVYVMPDGAGAHGST
jgi:hypothetical protein